METSVIETVAKYFYFLSLNEQLTFAASFRVLGELRTYGWLDTDHRGRWVEHLSKWKGKMNRIPPRDWSHFPDERGFNFPEGFSSTGWLSFMNNGDPVEVEVVLLSRILGFSDEDISSGLGVSVGTVRYRVGRGLRHMGGYLES